jgi:hypothetical protein
MLGEVAYHLQVFARGDGRVVATLEFFPIIFRKTGHRDLLSTRPN